MKIINLLVLTLTLGASTALYGDIVKDFRNQKKVGICYAGKEDVNMQEKRRAYMACEKVELAECKGKKGGKFLKCRKDGQTRCVQEHCEL